MSHLCHNQSPIINSFAKKTRVFMFLILVIASCGNPVKDIPLHGLSSAAQFCFDDEECELSGYGKSTTVLPYSAVEDVYGRWCVEVLFESNGQKGSAVVKVEQNDPDPMSLNWTYTYPVFNTDCSYFE